MKTAIIIAGATRQINLTHRFWDKLPTGDLYYCTWDVIQQTYEKTLHTLTNEVEQIQNKIQFKDVIIVNYQKEYLDAKLHPFFRPFQLLEKVYNKIKDQGYERVIYFRPDIKLFYLDDYNSETDFDLDYNIVKILGDYWPETFWDSSIRKMNDLFFVFGWKNFELFLNNKDFICSRDVHSTLFEFFESHKIKIEPLTTMRCVILRNNIDESNIDLDQTELTKLFLDVFKEKDKQGKFSFPEEIEFIDQRDIDYEYLKFSRNSGGILKLRNK